MYLHLFRVLVLVVAGFATATVHSALIVATASLDGTQEVPPNASTASGVATITFDLDANTLDLTADIDGISLSDITFSGAPLDFGVLGPFHIHNAPAGDNGGIVVPFPDASFFSDTATGLAIAATGVAFDAALIPELKAGNLYLNLHTLDFPGGEVRGQLAVVTEPGPLAALLMGLLALGLLRRRRAS